MEIPLDVVMEKTIKPCWRRKLPRRHRLVNRVPSHVFLLLQPVRTPNKTIDWQRQYGHHGTQSGDGFVYVFEKLHPCIRGYRLYLTPDLVPHTLSTDTKNKTVYHVNLRCSVSSSLGDWCETCGTHPDVEQTCHSWWLFTSHEVWKLLDLQVWDGSW
jgi:hypothetical protein